MSGVAVRSDSRWAVVARAASEAMLRWGMVVTLVVAWQLLAMAADSVFFPTPVEIARAFHRLWLSDSPPWVFTDAVFTDIMPSLGRMFAGWLIAAAVGISLGLAIGQSQLASNLSMPTVNFLRSTPGPALIPVFLILLGTGTTMRVALIAFSSTWPVLLNTIDGVRGVDRTKLETAAIFSMPRRATMFRVVLPAAMPKIVAGLRVATAVALVLMVISELVAATNGIGHHIITSQQRFRLVDMWAGIVLLGSLGYLINVIFMRLETRILHWHLGERRRGDTT